jgi:predicted DNA-binding WGR domain protein
VVDFQQYARFERIDRPEHCERFYLLAVQPTLLGDISLVRTWGRIGTQGKSLSAPFPDRSSAQETVERLVRRRLKRRYELVAWT